MLKWSFYKTKNLPNLPIAYAWNQITSKQQQHSFCFYFIESRIEEKNVLLKMYRFICSSFSSPLIRMPIYLIEMSIILREKISSDFSGLKTAMCHLIWHHIVSLYTYLYRWHERYSSNTILYDFELKSRTRLATAKQKAKPFKFVYYTDCQHKIG